MINEVSGRNLIDRARPILPQSVWLGPPAEKIFVHVTARVFVNLNLEAGDYRAPSRISANFLGVRSRGQLGWEPQPGIAGANEDAAVAVVRIETLELQAQVEIGECLGRE